MTYAMLALLWQDMRDREILLINYPRADGQPREAGWYGLMYRAGSAFWDPPIKWDLVWDNFFRGLK